MLLNKPFLDFSIKKFSNSLAFSSENLPSSVLAFADKFLSYFKNKIQDFFLKSFTFWFISSCERLFVELFLKSSLIF